MLGIGCKETEPLLPVEMIRMIEHTSEHRDHVDQMDYDEE